MQSLGLSSQRTCGQPTPLREQPHFEKRTPLQATEVWSCVRQLRNAQGHRATPNTHSLARSGLVYLFPRQEAAGF